VKHWSLRIRLEGIINDSKNEQIILENLRRCSRHFGKHFKVIFWHKNVDNKTIKKFVKRNENLLFEINTQITKKFENCWFLIDSMEIDKSSWRYKWDGDIVSGIVKYFQLLDFIVKETKR
jgi:hypothetical protein